MTSLKFTVNPHVQVIVSSCGYTSNSCSETSCFGI